jgi:subtilisin family serine protease
MIDSPVDVNHSAFKGQKVKFKSFHNAERKPGSANHGTAVAAMLVGKPAKEGFGGILPEATLFAANMFEINDRGKTIGNAMGLLKSLDWLATKKTHAINLSVAGNNNKIIQMAFKKASEYKLIMIAAAGNWGVEKPAYPAAFKDVIAITAVADKMKIYRKANRGDYIDFAAPGVRLWTAVPGGGKYQTGTSFASPYIAALAGLAIANGIKSDPGSLRSVFKKNVVDLGAPGKDKTFGYGYVHLNQKCGG